MLTVNRELSVTRSQPEVWAFVKEMGNWASQMPGYMSHEKINDNDSVWTMQMNLGPFTRPIVMDVHVLEWLEPSTVNFTVKGKFDPFQGKGSFASRTDGDITRIVLDFGVEGTGSMAKVVSAMAAPVLPAVADQFATNLKAKLQPERDGRPPATEKPDGRIPRSAWQRFLKWMALKLGLRR